MLSYEKVGSVMMKKNKQKFLNFVIMLGLILLITIITYGDWISKNNDYTIIVDKSEFELLYNLDSPSDVFIDLRDEEDYEAGHLSSFINIPYDRSRKLCEFLENNYHKNNVIVLMCYSSKRSSEAFNQLVSEGYHSIVVVNIPAEELLSEYNEDVSTGPCNCLD